MKQSGINHAPVKCNAPHEHVHTCEVQIEQAVWIGSEGQRNYVIKQAPVKHYMIESEAEIVKGIWQVCLIQLFVFQMKGDDSNNYAKNNYG